MLSWLNVRFYLCYYLIVEDNNLKGDKVMPMNIFKAFKKKHKYDKSQEDFRYSCYIASRSPVKKEPARSSQEAVEFCTNMGMVNINIHR